MATTYRVIVEKTTARGMERILESMNLKEAVVKDFLGIKELKSAKNPPKKK